MSFDNYGSYWDIDHVIPISNFDISDEHQLSKAIHWSNTRALEKTSNYIKKDKIVPNYIENNNNQLEQFNKIYRDISRKPDIAKIDDDFKLKVIDTNLNKGAIFSTGQYQVTGLTFIGSLVALAREYGGDDNKYFKAKQPPPCNIINDKINIINIEITLVWGSNKKWK